VDWHIPKLARTARGSRPAWWKKPAKTREELESAIRLEMAVVPHEDTWKVEIMRDGPQQDADLREMIEAIADRPRNQFDLKG
jgi:hypothetical protein